MKKLFSLLLAVIMVVSVIYVAPFNVKAATRLPDSIYLTQLNNDYYYGSCTFAAATMMLRARAYLSGYSNWSSITESSVTPFAQGQSGILWSFTYKATGISMKVAHNLVSGISVSSLKSLLNSHPEGIMLYCGNGNPNHAVFVTDYEGDTFYCADPAKNYSGFRQTLSSSSLGNQYGSQSSILSNVTAYWYVSSYDISGTHDAHSYDTYVYNWDAHPHYKCYKCSCGEVKENRNELTYVESCKDCQAHTCDQKIYYSYWAAHPHYYLYKCSLCGKESEDFSQKKYIDSCKDCQEHTCDQEVYYSYWAAHPHYYLYKCSLCGKESADYSQTKTVSGCEYCYPGKPTIIVDCDTFDSSVSFYWGSTTNTDNYTLHLHDVDNNYKYPLITNITDLHYKLSLPAGNYTVQLASINEELRGTNRWYTMSDIVEFSVINKPLIMIGDTDGDGKVTIKDATTIQKHVAGITTISDAKFACADTDKDGKISVKDATRIQKFLAALIPEL